MFTWTKLEIWIAGLLAAFLVVGGAGHLLMDWRSGSRVVVVEARSGSADEDTASVAAPSVEAVSVPAVDGEGAEVSEEDARDEKGPSAGGTAGGSSGPDEGGDEEEQLEDSEGADEKGARSPADGTEEEAVAFGVDERININTAPASELQRLPGIGPALSARIVAYREMWGPFSAIEDIMEVSGIGPAKFDAIRDLIKVR